MKEVKQFWLPRERDEQETSLKNGRVNSFTRFTSFTTREGDGDVRSHIEAAARKRLGDAPLRGLGLDSHQIAVTLIVIAIVAATAAGLAMCSGLSAPASASGVLASAEVGS